MQFKSNVKQVDYYCVYCSLLERKRKTVFKLSVPEESLPFPSPLLPKGTLYHVSFSTRALSRDHLYLPVRPVSYGHFIPNFIYILFFCNLGPLRVFYLYFVLYIPLSSSSVSRCTPYIGFIPSTIESTED